MLGSCGHSLVSGNSKKMVFGRTVWASLSKGMAEMTTIWLSPCVHKHVVLIIRGMALAGQWPVNFYSVVVRSLQRNNPRLTHLAGLPQHGLPFLSYLPQTPTYTCPKSIDIESESYIR